MFAVSIIMKKYYRILNYCLVIQNLEIYIWYDDIILSLYFHKVRVKTIINKYAQIYTSPRMFLNRTRQTRAEGAGKYAIYKV